MSWQSLAENWVLLPPRPIALIHFLGGAFVGTAPHLTYGRLLEALVAAGYGVIATPFLNTLDHEAIATDVLKRFDTALDLLEFRRILHPALPIYGLGHSMGCKLHLLIGSLFEVERAGNLLMSFNNFDADRAIPLAEWVSRSVTVKFKPSPEETCHLVSRHYAIPRNLLVSFQTDDLDQTRQISAILGDRFPSKTAVVRLRGNHLTPLGQDIRWQAPQTFSPLDALGQWVRQEVYRDLSQLEATLIDWLDPRVQPLRMG